MKHRFLVTGAGGFVGANLVHHLVAAGEEVHVLLRPETNRWRLKNIESLIRIHVADLRNKIQVSNIVQKVQPTVIYHLATHGAYHHQTDVQQILDVNMLGLWNLLEACNKVGYSLFVNTGSSSEYGKKLYAMRESDILKPDSFYAVAKSAQSLLCQYCSTFVDKPIVTFRLFSVYGPYEEPGRLFPNIMQAVINGRDLNMVASDTARDFIHVDDVIHAYLMIDKLKDLRGEILNVGTGIQTSLYQFVAAAEKLRLKPFKTFWCSMKPRTWDTNVWVGDISKIRRLIGFEAQINVEEGIKRSMKWYKHNLNIYS
ncbi:MAG TPA: GDP-mannose 4,6-dehydratase [Paludibacter sp.]|mgnify:CR=1 FL=1|jgi:nucleoside-diphosphate-sugar epimerase|nr:GDP-mannose 4,6-dehydratase [Paludibacter sp.]